MYDHHSVISSHHVTIRPRRVAGYAAGAAALLIGTNVAIQAVAFQTGHHGMYGLVRLFDLDAETNIPTFFSSTILLLSSAAVGLISVFKHRHRAPYARHWIGLACIFLYLAVDEAASIHELAIRPTREVLGEGATGVFYFAWVIPGSLVVLALAATYLKFWLHLPAATRTRVFWAGALYVGGAIGMELIGGRYAYINGMNDLTYTLIATAEEAMEMGGAILFLYAMLSYIEAHYTHVMVDVAMTGKRLG